MVDVSAVFHLEPDGTLRIEATGVPIGPDEAPDRPPFRHVELPAHNVDWDTTNQMAGYLRHYVQLDFPASYGPCAGRLLYVEKDDLTLIVKLVLATEGD
jgi:hypothetical protein